MTMAGQSQQRGWILNLHRVLLSLNLDGPGAGRLAQTCFDSAACPHRQGKAADLNERSCATRSLLRNPGKLPPTRLLHAAGVDVEIPQRF